MSAWMVLALLGRGAVAQEPAPEPAASSASSTGAHFTDDLDLRYWRSAQQLAPPFDDLRVLDYVEQVNRLTASFTSGAWRGFAQIDEVSLWANRYRLDGVLITERDVRAQEVRWPLPGDAFANVEKLSLAHERAGATVTLGDAYAVLGTGLLLNLNRNVDIDVDTSLQGIKLVARPGDWDLQAMAGLTNRQQVVQDNPNLGLERDRRHLVIGASAQRYGLGPASVGVQAMAARFATEPGLDGVAAVPRPGFDVVAGGGLVEASVLGVDWLAEVDALGFPARIDGDSLLFGDESPELGVAAYGSATAYVGATTWQLEGKRYRHAERVNALVTGELYELAIGPTLEYERAITEDSSATVNSNDLSGGRLRVDWAAVPGELTPYVSAAVFRDGEAGGAHFNTTPETVVHGLVGVEARGDGKSIVANAGYRRDRRDGSTAAAPDADQQVHGDLDVKAPGPVGTHLDLALSIEHFAWGNNAFQQQDYTELESSLTVGMPGARWFLVGFLDRTDNPLVDSKGNLSDALYAATELQYKAGDAVTVKAFYGAYKAGIRCAGGQCRLLPGFDGGRFSVVANF